MAKIRALFGANGQFVLLSGRPYWLPVNDTDYNNTSALSEDFIFHDEAFFPVGGHVGFEEEENKNVKIFNEELRRLEQQRLEMLALEELAKDLHAARAEYHLETLIDKIDFYLAQEELFDK